MKYYDDWKWQELMHEEIEKELRKCHKRSGRLGNRIAELKELLREAEALLCDPRGGPASNELAEKIIEALN